MEDNIMNIDLANLELKYEHFKKIKESRNLQKNGIIALLVLYLHGKVDKSIFEWFITTGYVSCLGLLISETTFGSDYVWLNYVWIFTTVSILALVAHEIWQIKHAPLDEKVHMNNLISDFTSFLLYQMSLEYFVN